VLLHKKAFNPWNSRSGYVWWSTI